MAREWKRGDVVVTPDGQRFMFGQTYFWGRTESGGSGLHAVHEMPEGIRPLVVVDPEDRAQVERLAAAYSAQPRGAFLSDLTDDLQAALRSLIEPPKPEEPTGLGAVVEDAEGEVWIKFNDFEDGDHWACGGYAKNNRAYRDINAVKVLSEGVTP